MTTTEKPRIDYTHKYAFAEAMLEVTAAFKRVEGESAEARATRAGYRRTMTKLLEIGQALGFEE